MTRELVDEEELAMSADENLPVVPDRSRRRIAEVLLVLLVLLVCLMATTTAYSFAAFMTYLVDIKAYFSLSQTEVELLLGINWLGLLSALPAGLILEKFGIRTCAFVATICSVIGNYFIYYACNNREDFIENTEYLALIFFVAGCGSGVTYLTAVTAAAQHVSHEFRASAISMVSAGSSLGPMLFIIFYDKWFASPVDLANYFLLVTTIFAAVNSLGFVVYGLDTNNKREIIDESLMLRSSMEALPTYGIFEQDSTNTSETVLDGEKTTSANDADIKSVWFLLTSPSFHTLFWPSILSMGIVFVTINNTSIFLTAVGLEDYLATLPFIPTCVGLFGKFTIGFVSDALLPFITRAWFLVGVSVLGAVVYFLTAFLVEELGMIIVNLLASELAYVVVIGLMPTIFSEEFGLASFPTCWGLVVAGISVSGFFFAQVFGLIYEAAITDETLECLGSVCFIWSFIGASLLSALSAVLSLSYLYNKQFIPCCYIVPTAQDEEHYNGTGTSEQVQNSN